METATESGPYTTPYKAASTTNLLIMSPMATRRVTKPISSGVHLQRQTAVTAKFLSEQKLLFAFVRQKVYPHFQLQSQHHFSFKFLLRTLIIMIIGSQVCFLAC